MTATTEELIPEVLNYLRVCGVMDGTPKFERATVAMRCVDVRGEWDENYMRDPYWQCLKVDFHKEQFEAIDRQLGRISLKKVHAQVEQLIPDTKKSVIIDIGSAYGVSGGGYLATKKPNAEVLLIDDFSDDDFPAYLFNKNHSENRIVLSEGRDTVRNVTGVEKRVNRLYKANGITNVAFHKHRLTLDDMLNLPDFLAEVEGRNVYMFGFRAPMVLPFIITKLYKTMNAKFVSISPTGQDRIRFEHFPWKVIQRNLGLEDQEVRGYFKSTFDPRPLNEPSTKYNYCVEAQKRIGVMIKLGIALALAKEVNGCVLRNDMRLPEIGYGQADHYIQAVR